MYKTNRQMQLPWIIDFISEGIILLDSQRKIAFCNQAAQKVSACPAQELLGRDIHEILPDLELAAAAGPETLQTASQECRLIRSNNQIALVLCKTAASPAEAPGSWLISLRDITQNRQLQERLRSSENKYQHIFEGSKDLIFLTTVDGRLLDINHAGVKILGYRDKSEIMGLGMVDRIFYNPLHWKVFKRQLDRQGAVWDFEAGFSKKDGVYIHCLLSGNANLDGQGRIMGYEAIAKDVTARMDADRAMKKRHRELMILNSIAFSMNITYNLQEMLQITLHKMLEVFKLRIGAIYLLETSQGKFSLQAAQGLQKFSAAVCDLVFYDKQLKKALLNSNLELPPYAQYPPFNIELAPSEGNVELSMVCFLISQKERPVGFFAFHVPLSRSITEQESRIIASVGNFLAGAIEKYNLTLTVHKHREELQNLTAQLFNSQERERRRISQELHDEVGQALTGINLLLDCAEKELASGQDNESTLQEVKRQINHTYHEIRRISHCLHPSLLHDMGLEAALESYFQAKSRQCDLHIDFTLSGFESRLQEDLEIALYRISQEAFTNTLKHARANSFTLRIVRQGPKILFQAEDDGQGFDNSNPKELKNALGILSMRERVAMLQGEFELRTAPGQGLKIRIELPAL